MCSCNSYVPNRLKYIDVNKPETTPRLFAEDFITKKGVSEFGSVFNSKGDVFYFGIDVDGRAEIHCSVLKQKKWSEPFVVLSDSLYSYNDPFLSVKEDRLYFISDRPRNERDTIQDIDIWYSEIKDGKYSEPINSGMKINSDRNEYYISFTEKGAMYFSSNKNAEPDRKHDFDIYRSEYLDGAFQEPIKLSEAINSRKSEIFRRLYTILFWKQVTNAFCNSKRL